MKLGGKWREKFHKQLNSQRPLLARLYAPLDLQRFMNRLFLDLFFFSNAFLERVGEARDIYVFRGLSEKGWPYRVRPAFPEIPTLAVSHQVKA